MAPPLAYSFSSLWGLPFNKPRWRPDGRPGAGVRLARAHLAGQSKRRKVGKGSGRGKQKHQQNSSGRGTPEETLLRPPLTPNTLEGVVSGEGPSALGWQRRR